MYQFTLFRLIFMYDQIGMILILLKFVFLHTNPHQSKSIISFPNDYFVGTTLKYICISLNNNKTLLRGLKIFLYVDCWFEKKNVIKIFTMPIKLYSSDGVSVWHVMVLFNSVKEIKVIHETVSSYIFPIDFLCKLI
jgi:hypothetical protein